MTEHTPGPWVVDEDPTQDGDHLTMVTTPGRAGFMGTWIAGCIHNWNDAGKGERRISWAEAEANARLIAAAPELLEALKVAVLRVELANIEGYPILSAWLPDARDAIAKALGTTNEPPPCDHDWQPSPHHPNAELCTKCEARRGWSVPVSELNR